MGEDLDGNFAPKQYGKRLWICPSWQSPPDPEAINILLDPGMAFGTGSHATTALCLRWLEQADLRDKAVIDSDVAQEYSQSLQRGCRQNPCSR